MFFFKVGMKDCATSLWRVLPWIWGWNVGLGRAFEVSWPLEGGLRYQNSGN